MAYKVFISSTQKDSDLAQDLARRLKETGVQVVSAEKNLIAGDRIVTQVERSLRESDEVIVLLSDYSVESQWVLSELGAAFGLHKRVTPVLIGSPDIPSILQSVKAVKYSELPKYISDLRKRAGLIKNAKRDSHPSIKGAKNARATSR